jgi:hypothetical protein
MSATEIEMAIRQLPREEARKLLGRLQNLNTAVNEHVDIPEAIVEKWRARVTLPEGVKTTDEFLNLVRGDRD